MHIKVKDLPVALQTALNAIGYRKADIIVEARDTYSLAQPSGDGFRAFVCAVNLQTSEYKIEKGSWGGTNMFTANQVDSDTVARPLPPLCAVIEGHEGGSQPVCAMILAHQATLAPLLPAKANLTDLETLLLGILRTYNSTGRKEYLQRLARTQEGDTTATFERLIAAGYVTRNRAGAMSLTTEGKNAAPAHNVQWRLEQQFQL